MAAYKITFNLKSAVSFIDRPMFDGLLSYCVAKEELGDLVGNLTLTKEQVDFICDRIPLKSNEGGWFSSSWMLWDGIEHVEFTDSWKKRWNEKHDHLVDFGKKVKKVRIGAGDYKSYNMPLTLHGIKQVWFYFETEDVERVEYLLSKHLVAIGKKTSQGWGEIKDFDIEQIESISFAGLRPIPFLEEEIKIASMMSLDLKFMPYRPPYWLASNSGWCTVK